MSELLHPTSNSDTSALSLRSAHISSSRSNHQIPALFLVYVPSTLQIHKLVKKISRPPMEQALKWSSYEKSASKQKSVLNHHTLR